MSDIREFAPIPEPETPDASSHTIEIPAEMMDGDVIDIAFHDQPAEALRQGVEATMSDEREFAPMTIERTAEDTARFHADMQRIARSLRHALRLTDAVLSEILDDGPAVLGPRPDGHHHHHGHRD